MTRFEHPEALYLLVGLIPLGLIFILYMRGRQRALSRMGVNSLLSFLAPQQARTKHIWKFVTGILAYTALVFALANPQIGQSTEKVKRQGVDIFIALDISNSMMAEDVPPSRLRKARQFITDLLSELGGDRVGFIIFAGRAYLQVPITSDYLALQTLLKTISPALAGTQGTAIGDAIHLADDAFDRGEHKRRAMIILSDGENHEGEALTAAKTAAEKGMHIMTVGIGTDKGAPIPVYNRGVQVDMKKDRNGSIIFSKLNPEMLKEVAQTGNGSYLNLKQGSGEVSEVVDWLDGLEQAEFEEQVFTDYEDQYQWFLGIAILLLAIEFFISEKRSGWLSRSKIFS
ncbi:MAG: VWA domain-containing protein [Bacteroidota bacterium]